MQSAWYLLPAVKSAGRDDREGKDWTGSHGSEEPTFSLHRVELIRVRPRADFLHRKLQLFLLNQIYRLSAAAAKEVKEEEHSAPNTFFSKELSVWVGTLRLSAWHWSRGRV